MGVRESFKLKVLSTFVLLALILSNSAVIGIDRAYAQIEPPDVEVVNPYFTVEKIQTDDGQILERGTINAPPKPLPEFEAERLASIQPLPSEGIIPSFPSYDWVFGCSAVSGAMIAAYYDNNSYPNMYAGPTNGGVMPQSDTSWPTWSDGFVTYPNNPLVASHNGVDGRAIKGSIDDYWVKYGSTASDPYIGNWTQHTWSDAIGDYMKTSQSAYNNTDGSSSFYNWNNTAPDPSVRLTCTQMEGYEIDHLDATYGRKLFYEARGYSVGDCYNQNTDNNFTGGFSLADFQAEIDAGHPVLLNLEGHSIVGYGYNGSTVYIRDTWDNVPSNTYTMPWGGSYGGMELYSVSVVRLNPAPVPPSAPTGISASDGTFTDRVRITWNAASGATYYKVFRNSTNTTVGATELVSSHPSSTYDDFSVTLGSTYFYWVKACNSAGCSGYSSSDSGYAISGPTIPPAPTGISASDGTFTNKVTITWNAASGATYYKVFRNSTNTTIGATEMVSSHPSSPYDDFSVSPGSTYFYWVKACNSGGCSGYSSSDSGYATAVVPIPPAPTGVSASDGTFTNKVHITWNPASGATYYDIYRNTSNSHVSELLLVSGLPFSPHDDFSVVQDVPYYYWVKACNTTGCSDYSSSDSGYAASEVTVNMIYLPLVMGQEDIPPQTIINGDFEQAHVGWTEYSSHGWDIITPDSSAPVSAHSGNWLAWLGGDYSDTSYVSQSILIPPGTPFLHYWYWIGSEDICGYDYFRIKLGTTTMHTKDLCGSQNTVGWVEGVVNLSAFAGTTQNLKFEVTTDSSGNSNLFLEDVSISGIASAYEGVVIPDYVNLDSVKSER